MIEFYAFCLITVFCLGILTVLSLGIKKHYFYLFVTAIQVVYLFNTPFHRFLIDDYIIVAENVRDYFPFGFSMILLHVVIFNLFYFLTNANYRRLKFVNEVDEVKIRSRIFKLFAVLFTMIFLNTLAGGINLVDVVLGKSDTTTLGLPGATYYIQNFADSLITLLVAAYIFKVKRRHQILMFVLGMILFIILGFRYRILLTVFAIVLYHIYTKGIKARLFIRYTLFSIVFLYSLLFLTYNRVKLYSAQYDILTYEPSQFNYDIFFDQAKGSLVDFALYQALDKNVIESDKGETTFLYIFIKMTPAKFFPGGKKPYPPPFFPALDKAIGGSRDIGEAATMLGALYFAFSTFGIVLISVILGIVTKRMTVYGVRPLSFLLNVMIMMAIFQFYTRGYLPQFLDHLAYMVFPWFFLRKFVKDVLPDAPQTELR